MDLQDREDLNFSLRIPILGAHNVDKSRLKYTTEFAGFTWSCMDFDTKLILRCNYGINSSLWSCTVAVEVKVYDFSKGNKVGGISKHNSTFTMKIIAKEIPLTNVIKDPIKYKADNPKHQLVAHVSVRIVSVVGIRLPAKYDFLQPNQYTNRVLNICGTKIYVNKDILSMSSSYFNTMFNGDFCERNENEVEIKGVDPVEFIELLNVIYPSHTKSINRRNVQFLLPMADMFNIPMVVDFCESYLKDFLDSVSAVEDICLGLSLADKYKLCEIQQLCLLKIKSPEILQKIMKNENYTHLSNETKLAVLEKSLLFDGPSHKICERFLLARSDHDLEEW